MFDKIKEFFKELPGKVWSKVKELGATLLLVIKKFSWKSIIGLVLIIGVAIFGKLFVFDYATLILILVVSLGFQFCIEDIYENLMLKTAFRTFLVRFLLGFGVTTLLVGSLNDKAIFIYYAFGSLAFILGLIFLAIFKKLENKE